MAQEGHAAATKQLIEARCNVDLQDEHGCTPLFIAAEKGDAAVTELLIAARCNVDLQDKDGCKNSDDLFKVSRDKNCRMPSVLLTKSNYENAGLGLFANEKISKGTKVTEFGGEIIPFEAAQELAKTQQHTHCLVLEARFLVVDGRVHKKFTKEWYCTHHKAGAFVNSAIDPKESNATYQWCAGKPPYMQPYKNEKTPDLRCSQKRIYVVATRDIEKGEEIVTHYRF